MLKILKIFFLCCSCVFFASGCATSAKGPAFEYVKPKDEYSSITHYRAGSFVGGGVAIYLYSNDKYVTYITNGGYFTETLKPGIYEYKKLEKHYVGIMWDAFAEAESLITVNTAPGEEYYIKWSPIMFSTDGIQPALVSKEQALGELEGLKRFEFQDRKEAAESDFIWRTIDNEESDPIEKEMGADDF